MWISDPKTELWAGDDSTYAHAIELAARINAEQQAFLGPENPKIPSLLTVSGGVGVIEISGPLFTSAPDWAKAVFGVTDYPQIREALVEAAKNPEVGSILLDVNSGGGAVNGVMDVASLVRTIDEKVKPVIAYAGGTMASAAYWIPSGAREILAGEVSEVGSIGVIARHMEQSKALADEGITVTTVRSGPYKQAINPYEPLSELAKRDLQSKIDYTYGLFLGAVADARGVPLTIADSKFGQGRTFLGDQALEAGLVDGIATFEEVLDKAAILAAESVDKRKSLNQNAKKQKEGKPMSRKAALTEQDIAAIASGAVVLGASIPETPAEPAADPVLDAAAPSSTAAPDLEAAADAPAAAAAPAAPAVDPAVVALLQSQLKDANDALLSARLESARLTEQVAALQVANEALTPIARDAVTKMYIALGKSGGHVASLADAQLVAEHAKASEAFRSAFPIGGVSASGGTDKQAGTSKADPAAQARIQATRFVK